MAREHVKNPKAKITTKQYKIYKSMVGWTDFPYNNAFFGLDFFCLTLVRNQAELGWGRVGLRIHEAVKIFVS